MKSPVFGIEDAEKSRQNQDRNYKKGKRSGEQLLVDAKQCHPSRVISMQFNTM